MNRTYRKWLIALPALALGFSSCKKDYENPNAAEESLALGSSKGMMAITVGLQRAYGLGQQSSLYSTLTATGFTTNEVILRNAGNVPELQLSQGGNQVDPTNTVLANIWINANKIIFDANRVQAAAATLGDRGYASGLIAYSSIWEALALGNMAMYWERVPDSLGVNVTFSPRVNGYNRAVAVIDAALAAMVANPVTAQFTSELPAGINLFHTLQALKARYALFAGNNAAALQAANLVDLGVRNVMNFEAANPNSIFAAVTSTNNVYQPIDSTLGLPAALAPDLADRRVPFHIGISTNPRFRLTSFYTSATSPVPIYLPGEIILIKAEALARTGDLPNAIVELNKVVTKMPSQDAFGVAAQLAPVAPATVAECLDQVYRNRCIELYQSSLKMEDMRRFGRPLSERRRNFFPYPFRERDNNTNTPPDPLF